YTGCDASFMVRCVRVVKQGIAAWEVCVDPNTEISTHNHDTSKIIYDSYRGAKSMSIPAQLSGRVLETIQTIVIDKDFVEWRVLDKAFPDAKVLLCQFHALTYWHKVCKCDKFKMKVTERDTMESAFAKLIYW
ncbi:hypothetical protein JG687_00018619, partial [Phytophthora cactorum]